MTLECAPLKFSNLILPGAKFGRLSPYKAKWVPPQMDGGIRSIGLVGPNAEFYKQKRSTGKYGLFHVHTK